MHLHNTKISKILKVSKTQYDDRKSGIIRVPSLPVVKKSTKNSKKKKMKRKINTGIDFTIVVKGEDHKVEEIRVKDTTSKLQKKKVNKSGEEEKGEVIPDYKAKIAQYMEALENTYQKEKNGKDLKKVKIKASARMIQKAWTLYIKRKKILKEGKWEAYNRLDSSVVNKIILIQNWYRASKNRINSLSLIKEKLKSVYFGRKILNRLKWLKKRKLTFKNYSEEEVEEIINSFKEHENKIKTIQRFITQIIPAKILSKKIDKIYIFHNNKGKLTS